MQKNENKIKPTNETKKIRSFHLEADKSVFGISVSISGVISILDFCEEYAVLKLRGGKIRVYGLALSISVYENKIVEINGRIGGVEFL